ELAPEIVVGGGVDVGAFLQHAAIAVLVAAIVIGGARLVVPAAVTLGVILVVLVIRVVRIAKIARVGHRGRGDPQVRAAAPAADQVVDMEHARLHGQGTDADPGALDPVVVAIHLAHGIQRLDQGDILQAGADGAAHLGVHQDVVAGTG